MSFLSELPGSLVLGPMTKGSNLPYRRLCVELGARVTVSEMTVARRLKQKRRSEFALIRRAPDEPCFGVQLAGNQPDEMAWAAALAVSRGAEFVDVNLGCPIDYFTSKGLGAALARQPKRVQRIVEEMVRGVPGVPVTVKFRLGWNADNLNYLDVAKAAVDGGAAALFVHGRTRDARYRTAADWNAVGEVVRAVPVPVIGNGDVLFPHDVDAARARSGCAAVMAARGVLIKPWLYREMHEGYRDLTGGRAAGHLPPLRRACARALGRRRPRPRAGRRLHVLALRLLVPVRSAAAGRIVAGTAGSRGHDVRPHAARAPARAGGPDGPRLDHRTDAGGRAGGPGRRAAAVRR